MSHLVRVMTQTAVSTAVNDFYGQPPSENKSLSESVSLVRVHFVGLGVSRKDTIAEATENHFRFLRVSTNLHEHITITSNSVHYVTVTAIS